MRTLVTLLVVVLALTVAVSASAAAAPTLKGSVGPGFTITLRGANGKPVKTLRHGTYRIVVSDRASIHDFVLEGPGVERELTTVSGTGVKTATVKLRPGTYQFYCRPHESMMHGSFKVS